MSCSNTKHRPGFSISGQCLKELIASLIVATLFGELGERRSQFHSAWPQFLCCFCKIRWWCKAEAVDCSVEEQRMKWFASHSSSVFRITSTLTQVHEMRFSFPPAAIAPHPHPNSSALQSSRALFTNILKAAVIIQSLGVVHSFVKKIHRIKLESYLGTI